MATDKQALGELGEKYVVKYCSCPRCKRHKTLVRLPANFKCADVICDFCGYLGQVKTSRSKDINSVPKTILGAAWGPQSERMAAAIYFPLFLVLMNETKQYSIFYLSADVQTKEMFKPRTPLSENAKRAGWQGFVYDTRCIADHFIRLR
ncbi:DpnI domain-containing protein [Bartonella sp. LJL80]